MRISTYSSLDQDSLNATSVFTVAANTSSSILKNTNLDSKFYSYVFENKMLSFYQQNPIQARNFSKFKCWLRGFDSTRLATSDLGMESEWMTDYWIPSSYLADFITCLLQCKPGNRTGRVLGNPWASWKDQKTIPLLLSCGGHWNLQIKTCFEWLCKLYRTQSLLPQEKFTFFPYLL